MGKLTLELGPGQECPGDPNEQGPYECPAPGQRAKVQQEITALLDQ
jgi:hypothetical protein